MSNSQDLRGDRPDDPSPSSDGVRVVVAGFDGTIVDDSTTSSSPDEAAVGKEKAKLRWYAAPDSWPLDADAPEAEGQGGSWSVRTATRTDDNQASSTLLLSPPTKKDFWRKTYYEPILVKDDGPFLFAELDEGQQYTVEAAFVLAAQNQFDQAGILVRLDFEHWIKTGIEVVDGVPRLSCVVTNSYSDWSTQPWGDYQAKPDAVKDGKPGVVVVPARVRVHCRHTSFVVEAWMDNKWEFIRICHLSRGTVSTDDPLRNHPNVSSAWEGPAPPAGRLWAGIFGACPIRAGAQIEFQHFSITHGSQFDHNAD